MPIAKTLSDYRDAVVYQLAIGGAVGTGDTFRHPLADLDRELNSVYASFREELTTRDFDFFIEETEQEDLPSERADTNEQYLLIDWPINALMIRRVDIFAQARWESLPQIDWARVRDVLSTGPSTNPYYRPRWYAVKNHGKTSSFEGVDGTEYEQVAGEIALLPFPNGGGRLKVKMSYLPIVISVVDDDELLLFPDEVGFRWCVWSVVARLASRDRNAGKRYDMALQQIAVCEQKIGRFVPRVINTGPQTMRRSPRYNG